MPIYQKAKPFDIVDTILKHDKAIKALKIQNSAQVRKQVNQQVGTVNQNPYFWGLDPTGWTAINGTFSAVSDPPAGAAYPYAGKYVNNGASIGFLTQQNGLFVANAVQVYKLTAWVYPTSASVVLGFNWFNGFLGSVTGPTNPTFALTANAWSRISVSLQSPAGTVYGCPIVGPSAADGSTVWAQAMEVTITSTPGSWNDMRPLSNSFVGSVTGQYPPQYRLNPDGTVEVVGWIQFPSAGGPNFNSVTFATLPAAYRPNSNAGHRWPITLSTNATGQVSGTVFTPNVQIDTSGNLQFHNCPISAMASNVANIAGRFPLDSSGLILS